MQKKPAARLIRSLFIIVLKTAQTELKKAGWTNSINVKIGGDGAALQAREQPDCICDGDIMTKCDKGRRWVKTGVSPVT